MTIRRVKRAFVRALRATRSSIYYTVSKSVQYRTPWDMRLQRGESEVLPPPKPPVCYLRKPQVRVDKTSTNAAQAVVALRSGNMVRVNNRLLYTFQGIPNSMDFGMSIKERVYLHRGFSNPWWRLPALSCHLFSWHPRLLQSYIISQPLLSPHYPYHLSLHHCLHLQHQPRRVRPAVSSITVESRGLRAQQMQW